jgi:gamma-glutamyltranspeptidase / glutathione hydrolase
MKFSSTVLIIVFTITGCSIGSHDKNAGILEGPGIHCRNGMVVSDHPEASRIGLSILKKGGNAVDAAVATGLALAVCYPEAGNIGGGGFMLIRTSDGKTDVIDYRETAPVKASRDMYLDKKGDVVDGLSTDTHLSCGVPGSIDGLITAHQKYGKLSFRDVIRPAIDLALKGFPLQSKQAASLNSNRRIFLDRNHGKTAFVKDSLWKQGDLLIQPDLARTLIRVRDLGRDGFYSGETAGLILNEMKRDNGIISGEDLTSYKAVIRKPLNANYHGYKIISPGPPSGGGVTLMQLFMMSAGHDLKGSGFHTPKSVHLITESERRAFADRAEFLGDPDFIKIPVLQLVSEKYISERMKSFDAEKATPSAEVSHGEPLKYESEQTTHYSVVDSLGNAVATTTTLNNTFGNSIVVEGAGFLLNDEMDDFSSKPGTPNMFGLVGGEANSIQPGKRMLSSMTPTIIEKDQKLFLIVGSPGGSTIPTTVFQVIVNVIDYGMSIQGAVNAGRFHHQWLPDFIQYEKSSLDSATVKTLESMGHKLRVRGSIGLVNAIQIFPDGSKEGGADPRGYNSACGY